MKSLITGAASGIGKEFAIYLDELGFELVLVDKDKEKLESLQNILKNNSKIVVIDLANEKNIKDLYIVAKNENIELLINNAGFGLFGDYSKADVLRELEMIDVNIKAVHLLTRMFLKDMDKKGRGYILNVASSAGLLKGGPLMSTYYATKSYVVSFTNAIYEELRRNKSKVKIASLCPGPVNTNFNDVAGVTFNMKSLSPNYVVKYAINCLFKTNKILIVPKFTTRIGLFFSRFLSTKLLLKLTYKFQKRKEK